jgi:hypothetical protein
MTTDSDPTHLNEYKDKDMFKSDAKSWTYNLKEPFQVIRTEKSARIGLKSPFTPAVGYHYYCGQILKLF